MEGSGQIEAGRGMTLYSSRLALCFLGLLAIALFSPSCVHSPELVPVTGDHPFVGEMQMRRAGSTAWARIRPETVLYVGDTVRARQLAEITFLDGTIATLEPGSFLEIGGFDPHKRVLHLKTELASIEANAAQAKIHVAQNTLEIIADSGYVNIRVDGKKNTLQAGQVAQLVSEQNIIIQAQITAIPNPSPTPLPVSPTPPPSKTPPLVRPYLPLVMGAYTPTPTRARSATPTVPAHTPSAPPTAAPTPLVIRVNCGGGPYKDKAGQLWAADQHYKENSWGYVGGNIYTTGNAISGTEDDLLYQSERWGNFFYLFDIPNGRYRVTLRFADIYRDNPGVRKFTVRIEGHVVLQSLDLVAQVGRDVAYDRTFSVELNDKQLGIEFLTELDMPKISAIAIEAIR